MAEKQIIDLTADPTPLDADIFETQKAGGGPGTSRKVRKDDFLAVIQGEVDLNTAKVSATGSVTTHSDVTNAGSGQIITVSERNAISSNTLKVSADGSVTTHNDVTDAGSGAIITVGERALLGTALQQVADDGNPALGGNLDLAGFALGTTALVTEANLTTLTDGSNADALHTHTDIGEVNTASNQGAGEGGVFIQKTGVDLEFRTILAGANITVTQQADTITIATGGAVGEANTASNVGAGEGVFAQKNVLDLEFKSLIARKGITVSSTADEITFDGVPFTGAGAIGMVPDPLTSTGNNYLADDGAFKAVPVSPVGGAALSFNFDSDTNTAVDPGTGDMRVNNADQTLATIVSASITSALSNNIGPILLAAQPGDYMGIWDTNSSKNIYYSIDAFPIDNTTWVQFPVVSHIPGTPGGFNNGESVELFLILDPENKLPVGGTADQVLAKIDGDNFDTYWKTAGTETLLAGAGVAFVEGEVGYLNASQVVVKATAAQLSTANGPLYMAVETIDAGTSGIFAKPDGAVVVGNHSSITVGAPYYLDAVTPGAITATPPSGSSQIVRIVGYGRTATSIEFAVDPTWIELIA
jgi:hypothetical protein